MLVEILDERARERRMRAGITVSGEISRQRGIGDEQRAIGLAHERQPRKPEAEFVPRTLREGIVAASV